MQTLSFKLPAELHAVLEAIAQKHDRPKSYVLRKALEAYAQNIAEEEEDVRVAEARLRTHKKNQRVSLKAIQKKYGLGY